MDGKSTVLNKKRGVDTQRLIPIVILVAMVVFLSIANPNFLSIVSLRNLLSSVAATGIVAVGAMCVIITGGIDFTSGYGLATAAVTAGVLYSKTNLNLTVLLVSGIVTGVLIGVVNGLLIVRVKLPAFIATLGMMSVLQGLSLLISGGQQLILTDPAAKWIGQAVLLNTVPVCFVLFLLISFIGYLLLNKTKMGVYIYTMGGNENAARVAGVDVGKYKFLLYTFAGTCTGIAAIVSLSRVAYISTNVSTGILMDAISSAVIGGTSVSGGKGTVGGMIVGVLIMGLVTTLLTFLNVDPLLRDGVKGGVIVIALLIDVAINRVRKQ